MRERSRLVSRIRSEIIGPFLPDGTPHAVTFSGREWKDEAPLRQDPVVWYPTSGSAVQEILYFQQESPHRKYGSGLLHPPTQAGDQGIAEMSPDELALKTADTLGADMLQDDDLDLRQTESSDRAIGGPDDGILEPDDDFEVTSPDVRHPSTMGLSLCVKLENAGEIVVLLPKEFHFSWQLPDDTSFPVNGRYELCTRFVGHGTDHASQTPVWRRLSAVPEDCRVRIPRYKLISGKSLRLPVSTGGGESEIKLLIDVFPRYRKKQNEWLLTIVLRNTTEVSEGADERELTLYQTLFVVTVQGGSIRPYPESERPFNELDLDERSLALLYHDSVIWGIGHGCAAAWDTSSTEVPSRVFADVLPAVQLPSITADIQDAAHNSIRLSMRSLADLPDSQNGPIWQSLENIAIEYGNWINRSREEINALPANLSNVATRHLDACEDCQRRINNGIALLRTDAIVRRAFRLANLAMLLQQISTKQLKKRPLDWDDDSLTVRPRGEFLSPWDIFEDRREDESVGIWRTFQIAFLLMSLQGLSRGDSPDRSVVDLIWFPTGGGKTEAYLAAMAFYMFHERLSPEDNGAGPRRDGTNVILRYTLRMLTTQQFQRAASLITAMEHLRRSPDKHMNGMIPGNRFSLALWIGGQGSPNSIKVAERDLTAFRKGDLHGNPLVLTECPWCRSEIGRFDGPIPKNIRRRDESNLRLRGVSTVSGEGPLLHCTDPLCEFGTQSFDQWLPIEVIDERIYRVPPSLVIATADKLAMVAYRPKAGALFGRDLGNNQSRQKYFPPGLIVQDELHLISGPLGTLYGLYEVIFEALCSSSINDTDIKPKIISSTATIRGAADQILSLYGRDKTVLFPSPGLRMSDSFFGTYARDEHNQLKEGRLYVGIHGNEYGSLLTTQVRTFSAALYEPYKFTAQLRDPWWTLLVFYNSIRELGGAKTLFDSDIRSRLKFLFNRDGFDSKDRRNIRVVEELTSRLSQAEIVGMMDRLSEPYTNAERSGVLDSCLASNIIEVGVDIDRLSLMAVVGQPKSSATYIQVTGRIGRRWWERPGLVLTLYSPSRSRDRSHFEQFHSYHRRLYERVEPTSITPFATSAVQRAMQGALILWARQHSTAPVEDFPAYRDSLEVAYGLLRDRCKMVQTGTEIQRSLEEMERVHDELIEKWKRNPQEWEKFPQAVDGEYLMLWPGQFATSLQHYNGVEVASSLRQVDRTAELYIDPGYADQSDNQGD